MVFAFLGIVADLGTHGDDPDIVEYGFADPARGVAVRVVKGLSENHVHPIAWKNQAGIPRRSIDWHGNSAHAWRKHGCEETTITRLDDNGVSNWLADGDASTHHCADDRILFGFAPDDVVVRNIVIRPALPADVLRLDELARRKSNIGHENLHRMFCDRLRCRNDGDRSLLVVDPASSIDRGDTGHRHGEQQDDYATRTHWGLPRVATKRR